MTEQCASRLVRPGTSHRGEVRACNRCNKQACVRHRVGDVCRKCRAKQYRDTYEAGNRKTWTNRDLVETVLELAEFKVSRAEMLVRVGMGWSGVRKAFCRAGLLVPERFLIVKRKVVAGGGTSQAQEELAGPGDDGSALEADDFLTQFGAEDCR